LYIFVHQMFERIKYHIEQRAFEMFSFLGEKLGIESRRIRMFFIYVSFVAVGSPFIVVAMIANFWKYLFEYFVGSRGNKKMWDL